MASLIFSDNAGRQVVHPLDRDQISIGRAGDNDIVSLDLRVSRRHAVIVRDPASGAYTIHDQGSSLGVFVNHRRMVEAPLRDGDVIRIGDSLYSFVDLMGAGQDVTLGRTLSGVMGHAPSDAGLRGSALVAELQDALGSLRRTVQDPSADRRILDQCLSLVEGNLEGLRRRLVQIERARSMMQTLYEVGKVINSSYDRGNLLELILELAVQVIRAERGFLSLYDAASGRFEHGASINMREPAAGGPEAGERDFSTGIALSVARSGQPIVTTDAMADERFRERQSVMELNIRSALCVPLVDRAGAVMGVIYVDMRASIVTFTREDQEFLMAFANYASIAVENAVLFAEAAEKARAEEELRQARTREEMKSDLIAIVSHDVRTPLTSIKSYAEILADDMDTLPPEQRRRFLEIINREADRLSRLVTNYLDLQKIEAGMMRLVVEPLAVNGLVEESVEAFAGAALEKRIALRPDLAPSLPLVRGDRDRLLQVLANLLSNAVKFTPEGGEVTVLARPVAMADGGEGVEIEVRDTGDGIPLDRIDNLFRRFAQVGEARGEARRGTGLGLVFSREIVELHGGRIAVCSTPGSGSAFRVVLPVDGA